MAEVQLSGTIDARTKVNPTKKETAEIPATVLACRFCGSTVFHEAIYVKFYAARFDGLVITGGEPREQYRAYRCDGCNKQYEHKP
jgi:hypothetical protein